MNKHEKPSYDRRPRYNAADNRTPEERERELLRSAQAEGREQPADGSRPLSVAHEGKPAAGRDQETGAPGRPAADSATSGGATQGRGDSQP